MAAQLFEKDEEIWILIDSFAEQHCCPRFAKKRREFLAESLDLDLCKGLQISQISKDAAKYVFARYRSFP